MYVDADTHVSSRSGEMGVDELLRQMDDVGVEKAVAWPKLSYTRQVGGDNQAIYQGTRRHPDRIIPFGGVNPMLGMEEAKGELKRCIEEFGVKGVKLNGARDGYTIDDPALSLPLVDMIAEAGIVLAFHCGSNDFERTHPFRIAKISQRHPDLPIMIVHMGGANRPTIHNAVIELAAEHPSWLLIDSEADYRFVLKAVEVLGAERVCYGSDAPFCPMRYEWAIRQAIYQDLSPEDRAKVLGGNMARLLGLG